MASWGTLGRSSVVGWVAVFGVLAGGCRLASDNPSQSDAAIQSDGGVPIDATVLDWHDDAYAARKLVTLSPPTSAVASMLADYPAAIQIATDTELAAASDDDGIDIKFAVVDGAVVAHEIESFDPATGELVAWVTVPALSLDGETRLYLYYDSPAAANLGDSVAVFAEPYMGVWHLSHDPTVLPPQVLDSAGTHHGSAVATGVPESVAGIVGPGLLFDGIDDNVTVPDPADGSLDADMDSITYSLWVRTVANAGQFDIPIYKGGATGIQPGYDMQLGTDFWSGKIADGVADFSAIFGMEAQFGGEWTYLVVVIDRSTDEVRSYADSVLTDTTSIAGMGSLANSRALEFSRIPDPVNAVLDEIRIYRGIRDANWIGVVFANIDAPDSFVSIGSEQRR